MASAGKSRTQAKWRIIYERSPQYVSVAQTMRNKSAPPKWSKLWTDVPQPGDHIGAYTTEHLEQMNQEFTAAVERAFRSGDESSIAARRTYDMRRPRTIGHAR